MGKYNVGDTIQCSLGTYRINNILSGGMGIVYVVGTYPELS